MTAHIRTKKILEHAVDRIQLGVYENNTEFFYDILLAYNIPKSAIDQLRISSLPQKDSQRTELTLRHIVCFLGVPTDVNLIQEGIKAIRIEDIASAELKFIFVTDFKDFFAYDLIKDLSLSAPVSSLPDNYEFFSDLAAYDNLTPQTPQATIELEDTATANPSMEDVPDIDIEDVDSEEDEAEETPLDTNKPMLNPEFVNGKQCFVTTRSTSLSKTKPILSGSVARDSGALRLNVGERADFIKEYPELEGVVKPLLRPTDFLNASPYFCLWLVDISKRDIAANPFLKERVSKVRQARLSSSNKKTREVRSKTPHLFTNLKGLSDHGWLAFTTVTNKKFDYQPFAFLSAGVAVMLPMHIMPNATLYDFAILMSNMHNLWRIALQDNGSKGINYRINLTYNTFPWPDVTENKQLYRFVDRLAQNVLLAREEYSNLSLAEMYNRDKMPDSLRAAHKALDLAVDRLYREAPFRDNTERLEHLFMRYEKLVAAETK